MIDYQTLRAWHFPVIEHRYGIEDAMRYALALGLGEDPMDSEQLRFVCETQAARPLAMPSMAVILGYPGSWMADPRTGIDFRGIVHGEELLTMHHPLPVEGTVHAHHRVVRVVDKGPGRGATISYEKTLVDAGSGRTLATVLHTTFARNDGGFSAATGLTDAPTQRPAPVPQRSPDLQLDLRTLPQQALLYRLCADRNPLHSDPATARAAGFPRPILHGLCSYGMACRSIVSRCCDGDPTRIERLFARFSSPVVPGQTLRFELYDEGASIAFRARILETGATALDGGRAHLQPAAQLGRVHEGAAGAERHA